MDWSSFADALLTTQTPLLPDLPLLNAARRLGWALVLASALLYLGARRWPRGLRATVVLVLTVWALLPGSLSPAYWLGLAFQMPSLMSIVLAACFVARQLRSGAPQPLDDGQVRALAWLGLAGIALGWGLLLDTFAALPLPASLYAWGFSPLALGAAAACALLPWVLGGRRHPVAVVSGLTGGVLLLYAVSRLPSGNLWDALLDPWLWIALQLGWLRYGVRRFSAARRAAAATRA